jgi:hypothetical protein
MTSKSNNKNKEYCDKMLLKDTGGNPDLKSMSDYLRCLKINNPEKDKIEREKRYTMRDLFFALMKDKSDGFEIR